jgi:hypothetical protein
MDSENIFQVPIVIRQPVVSHFLSSGVIGAYPRLSGVLLRFDPYFAGSAGDASGAVIYK